MSRALSFGGDLEGDLVMDSRGGKEEVPRPLSEDEWWRLKGVDHSVASWAQKRSPPEARRALLREATAQPLAQAVVAHGLAALAEGREQPAARAQSEDLKESPTHRADGEEEDRCGGGPQLFNTKQAYVGQQGSTALADARAELFGSQLAAGSRTVYARGFRYWGLWRGVRDRGPYLTGEDRLEDENELIDFYAYFGRICGYAYSTLHGWMHGIQHHHIIAGLGDPLDGRLRLKMVRKGFKNYDRRLRGRTRKLAATVEGLLDVIENGGLDVDNWDDAILMFALVFGFFKLRRSSEFLRTGAAPDAEKCVRVGDITLAAEGEIVEFEDDNTDELIAVQRKSKCDQAGRGVATNTFRGKDSRLCVVWWFRHLVKMKPGHFKDPTQFLFTCSDGRVLHRDVVSKTLQAGAVRRGVSPDDLDIISLRAGGASAMFHADYGVEDIRRRGRWASDCWKTYVQEGRTRARDMADRMAGARFALLGAMVHE